mmetsp:Transcript_71168/g.189234  ORF Transcript_71168/g.189234 Transcript_71168/m.189234 type:complete len:254 (-) Transcript_71168:102-863(-)
MEGEGLLHRLPGADQDVLRRVRRARAGRQRGGAWGVRLPRRLAQHAGGVVPAPALPGRHAHSSGLLPGRARREPGQGALAAREFRQVVRAGPRVPRAASADAGREPLVEFHFQRAAALADRQQCRGRLCGPGQALQAPAVPPAVCQVFLRRLPRAEAHAAPAGARRDPPCVASGVRRAPRASDHQRCGPELRGLRGRGGRRARVALGPRAPARGLPRREGRGAASFRWAGPGRRCPGNAAAGTCLRGHALRTP